ncbi:MAG TPA: thioredoxin family protein [Geomonas sp.]|nr:thioredoxin family protein [Geomonas sp.]
MVKKGCLLRVIFALLLLLLAGCASPPQGPLFNLKSAEFVPFSGFGFPQSKSVDEQWQEVSGYPLELTEGDFVTMTVGSSLPVVVEFYANWCGYCQDFRPLYRDLAEYYKNRVRFATIDADKSPKLKAKLQVKGFPAFFIIKNGKMLDRWYGVTGSSEGFRRRVRENLDVE